MKTHQNQQHMSDRKNNEILQINCVDIKFQMPNTCIMYRVNRWFLGSSIPVKPYPKLTLNAHSMGANRRIPFSWSNKISEQVAGRQFQCGTKCEMYSKNEILFFRCSKAHIVKCECLYEPTDNLLQRFAAKLWCA